MKRRVTKTTIVKLFNAVASCGLAISIAVVPLFDRDHVRWAVVALCSATTFAGLHTPGVQTALVHLAPPFSGVITGTAFFVVSLFSIGNKLLTKAIVQTGSPTEWQIVFEVSAVIAALPIVVFSLWGSAERQEWAIPTPKTSVESFGITPSSTEADLYSISKGSKASKVILPPPLTSPAGRKLAVSLDEDDGKTVEGDQESIGDDGRQSSSSDDNSAKAVVVTQDSGVQTDQTDLSSDDDEYIQEQILEAQAVALDPAFD